MASYSSCNAYSSMLNRIVLIKQPAPNNADICARALSQHGFHPVRRDDLSVVIQKKQVVALGFCCSKIHQLREIELMLPCFNSYVCIVFLQVIFVVVEGFLLGAIVFDNNDFVIAVGCIFDD